MTMHVALDGNWNPSFVKQTIKTAFTNQGLHGGVATGK